MYLVGQRPSISVYAFGVLTRNYRCCVRGNFCRRIEFLIIASPLLATGAGANPICVEDENHQIRIVVTDINKIWSVSTHQSSSGIGIRENAAGQLSRSLITSGGNVGIGTDSPSEKPLVGGNDTVVETGWADFVFADDYPLRPLVEVEQSIAANGHLTEIPPATKIEEEGVARGGMETRLLQEVEELALYTVRQQKEIDDDLKRHLVN